MKKRTLPTNITSTFFGSIVNAYYILDKSPSYFSLMKKWDKFKNDYEKGKNIISFKDIPSVVHSVAIYFNLKEDQNLPIVFCISDYNTILATIMYGNHILPNTPEGVPFAPFMHPRKVVNQKGEEINEYIPCCQKEED